MKLRLKWKRRKQLASPNKWDFPSQINSRVCLIQRCLYNSDFYYENVMFSKIPDKLVSTSSKLQTEFHNEINRM